MCKSIGGHRFVSIDWRTERKAARISVLNNLGCSGALFSATERLISGTVSNGAGVTTANDEKPSK